MARIARPACPEWLTPNFAPIAALLIIPKDPFSVMVAACRFFQSVSNMAWPFAWVDIHLFIDDYLIREYRP